MISIVIPTYNRADILGECLEGLAQQKHADGLYEIVIVNDGGTDTTSSVVESFQSRHPGIPVRYLEKRNEGQGIARNYGIREARGDVIVLIGDDILVGSDFVRRHYDFHQGHPESRAGLLGYIEWDPRTPVTPLYTFLTNGSLILGRYGGHQFAFEKLEGKSEATYDFFYTSNISLKKDLLLRHPFDESFLKYGWEDIELGYRLVKEEGFRLYYDKQVLVHHFHPMDEEELKRRMFAIGKAAVVFDHKYPELGKVPSARKRLLFALFSSWPMIQLFNVCRRAFGGDWHYWYYYAISKKFFLEGLQAGQKSL